jgi:hypothetical protein
MKLNVGFNSVAGKPRWLSLFTVGCLAVTSACGDDGGSSTPDASPPDGMTAPDAGGIDAMPPVDVSYEFESQLTPGQSSVNYSGQALRQVLITELTGYIGRLTAEVGTRPPADDAILAGLLFYVDFDSTIGGQVPLTIATDVPLLQKVYDDISTNKLLRDKLAGNDASTDHKPWNTPGNFQGWSEGGESADTPTELLEHWFGVLDDLAFQRGQGTVPSGPDNAPIEVVYLTPSGQDLQQLVQKFLTVAVTFSQGTDDYLDDDIEGKGILSPNTQDGTAPYTVLEHAWDEGFGYFGAARDYDQYTDDELSGEGGRGEYQSYHDTSGDGAVDLTREYNFAIAVNCAKRDRGSAEATDFTKDVFDAFVAGRQIIHDADGELTPEQLEALKIQRDIVVSTWEKCIAATVVHYINETLADMSAFGTAEYSFATHAKHWSELKGFSLGLQFNPRSPMLEGTRFADFHARIGDAPVLANAAGGQQAIDDYKVALQAARAIVQEAYGFSQANVDAW